MNKWMIWGFSIFLETPISSYANLVKPMQCLSKNQICHIFAFYPPRWHLSAVADTPPKTNMDTQNDGLEEVTPLKHGHFWYPC